MAGAGQVVARECMTLRACRDRRRPSNDTSSSAVSFLDRLAMAKVIAYITLGEESGLVRPDKKSFTASEAYVKNTAWAVGPLVLDTPSCPDGLRRRGMEALLGVPLPLACSGSSDSCRCRRSARCTCLGSFRSPRLQNAKQIARALSFCHGGCKQSPNT